MLLTKFGVNWPFGSGEETKNRFSRWRPLWPSWISDQNNFSYFCSTSHSDASYHVLSQLAQGCRSRLLKQLLTQHGAWRTLTDHNSSPWALCAQWAKKLMLWVPIWIALTSRCNSNGTHNICLYKEVDKKYSGCYLKISELLDWLDCAYRGMWGN